MITECNDEQTQNQDPAPVVRWLHIFPAENHVILALLTDEGPAAYRLMPAETEELVTMLGEVAE